jgi:hypothetical protein
LNYIAGMTLAVAAVVRNEASKWLQSTLSAWADFADIIVALDDGSTDATPDILQACPKVDYYRRDGLPLWGNEAPVRSLLWDLAVNASTDWLMVLDGDMLPASDIRPVLTVAEMQQADGVAFRLYDLWGLEPAVYRTDGFWQGHEHPRVWLVRRPPTSFQPAWNPRGIHTGHFPENLHLKRVVLAPPEYSLLHLAYSDKDARAAKWLQYLEKSHLLSEAERRHADSITDPLVRADLLPFPIQYSITKHAEV